MAVRAAAAMEFPRSLPAGYEPIGTEPAFDSARHLSLEMPDRIIRLAELGYGTADIAACPTDLAITGPFRLLSEEGVAALYEVSKQLERNAISCDRIERMVRGGVYRSRFLRDLCLAPELTAFLSALCGTPVAPHTLPHQLGHLNFQPREVGRNVDRWHHDTLGLDFVLPVTDPTKLRGGEFQYFHGTVQEAAALKQIGTEIPAERAVSVAFPGPGYAVLQQGNMVVHRAKALETPSERITMVNGYVFLDVDYADPTDFGQLRLVDPADAINTEWTRHKAWLAREKLARLVEELPFTADRDVLIAALRRSVADVQAAIEDLQADRLTEMRDYGDS